MGTTKHDYTKNPILINIGEKRSWDIVKQLERRPTHQKNLKHEIYRMCYGRTDREEDKLNCLRANERTTELDLEIEREERQKRQAENRLKIKEDYRKARESIKK